MQNVLRNMPNFGKKGGTKREMRAGNRRNPGDFENFFLSQQAE